MGKLTKVLLLSAFLFFSAGRVYSEETQEAKLEPLNVKEFREQLKEVSTNRQKPLQAEVSTFANRYIVSPGDTLNISIFGEPDFIERPATVKSDGYVNVYPVGEVNVAGNDVDQVNDILTAEFKTYYVNPKVSLEVSRVHASKIYIHGAVQKPGLYESLPQTRFESELAGSTPATLASAISRAGGIKYNADLENVQVINKKTGTSKVYNLLKLIRSGDYTQDIYLSSGDAVYIPYNETQAQISDRDFLMISSSSLAPETFPVRVIGAVTRPGVHDLNARSPRLNTAIASSEGFTLDAKINYVKVKRITPEGHISKIVVNPNKTDLILRPNDIVQVAYKNVALSDRFIRFLGGIGTGMRDWAEFFDPDRRYDWAKTQ